VKETYSYFGRRLIKINDWVAVDRLGSVRSTGSGAERIAYYPWGEERTTTADGRIKFGTYVRDSGPNGQDYADQRYYNQMGAFWSPDPGGIATADPNNPGSWNRYAYAYGDSINFFDPPGTNAMDPDARQGPSYYWGYGFYGYWGSEGYVSVYGPYLYFVSPGGGGGGGGGAGPDTDPRDFCDHRDATNAKVLDFIADNQAAANSVSAATGLGADVILAWGAYESGYGKSDVATENNSFYGLKPALGKQQVHWAGSDPYRTCSIQGYDCFTSQAEDLAASAVSALTSFGGKYLTAALAAQSAGKSVADIVQAAADAGFNSEYGPGGYGSRVNDAFQSIQLRKDCPK
jgi:RHS repeat-associated protein